MIQQANTFVRPDGSIGTMELTKVAEVKKISIKPLLFENNMLMVKETNETNNAIIKDQSLNNGFMVSAVAGMAASPYIAVAESPHSTIAILFVLLLGGVSALIPLKVKRRIRKKQERRLYQQQLFVWLRKTYKSHLDNPELEKLTKVLTSKSHSSVEFKDMTGKKYVLKHLDKNVWVVNQQVKESFTSNPTTLPLLKTIDAEVFIPNKKAMLNSDINEEENCDPATQKLNHTIKILQTLNLSAEEEYIVERAEKEYNETKQLTRMLTQIDSTVNVAEYSETLAIIQKDLDTIVKNQQQFIRSQFRSNRDKTLSTLKLN